MNKIYFLFVTLLIFGLQVTNSSESRANSPDTESSKPMTKVTGTVTAAESGESLPGVNIIVKGTTTGTITDFDGKYEIDAPKDGTLVFSFVGYETKEVPVNGQSVINVSLDISSETLDDVVVTALGIKREKKALGYAVQDVKGDELSKSKQPNLVNTLSGKVAGVQITNSSGQVGSSATIKIRGNKSFEGSSQPLFVVDGTPIMNSTSSARNYTATDFGNAAMDIDPSNIESISVLKGASAAALYGSRAANGVILITTKKGTEGQKGIGVELSSSVSVDKVYLLPNYQNDYGQGATGSEYRYNVYVDKKYDGDFSKMSYQEYADQKGFRHDLDGDDVNGNMDESWGPRLDAGLLLDQMHGDAQPWVSKPDNVKNFFDLGVTYNNNVALTAGNEKSSARFSFAHMKQEGTVPNTDQSRFNIGVNASSKLSDKLTASINANYVELSNDNLPQSGNSFRNPFLIFNSWFGRNVDLDYLKDHYEDLVYTKDKYWAMNWCYWDGQHPNPYWMLYKNTTERQRKRVYGNVSLTYALADGINLIGRVGTDFFSENRKYIYHQYSRDWNSLFETATNGTFWQQNNNESETNADLMLTIDKRFGEDFSLFANIGGNYRYSLNRYFYVSGSNLVIPNFFSTSNIEGEPDVSTSMYEKKSNSVFASANLGYKSYLFLDLTIRGDWSSTLPSDNWNYWYPSANLGFIFTDAFKLESDILSYGKVRAGYAVVGNDTGPYQLRANFTSGGTSFNGVNMFRLDTELPSPTLKPEKTVSFETGAEFKFLGNRAGLDITYYQAKTFDQLFSVPIAYSSGYNTWMKNAGSVENNGIEVQAYGTVVKLANGFTWDVSVNWSKNENEVTELADGIEELQIASMYSLYDYTLMAFPGEPWGTIYGTNFARNENGKILVNKKGLPNTTDSSVVLGNVNPDWIGGLRNTFTYKNFSLSVLIDMRKGGDIFSMTKSVGQKTGILQNTVDGGIRENGMIVDGVYEEGTVIDGNDVSGQTNTTTLAAETYWGQSRNWGELAIVDGTFIKLREIIFEYAIPRDFTQKFKIQSASVSVFGRNLALLYTDDSNDVNIDPEVSAGGTVSGTGLESYQIPASRTIGVKLDIKF